MDKKQVQAFATRVTQANRSELILILYEIVLADIESAREHYGQQEMEAYMADLKHSQRFMNELISCLNYQYPISYNLLQLYLYVNKRIISAIVKREIEPLESALNVMHSLYIGFEGVAKEDNSPPLMENTQQLFAGLTYGKTSLNETYIDPIEHSRGFKA